MATVIAIAFVVTVSVPIAAVLMAAQWCSRMRRKIGPTADGEAAGVTELIYSRASRSKSSSTAEISFCLRGSCAARDAAKRLRR
jgi:hypothetical protein